MSLRNRARSLQRKTGLSYQQSLAKLRALGERPAELSRRTGWPLEVCDRFCVDGHAPIDVVEVAPARSTGRNDRIVEICETLRATANARAVVLSAPDGRILVQVGPHDLVAALRGVLAQPSITRARVSPPVKAAFKRWVELPEVWELDGGIVLYTARFARGVMVVKFQRDETSLGLVRLRTARAIEAVERVLADDPKPPGVPPAGGGGRGGLPAEVRVVEETREAPPEPKPKPIGRKKK